MALKNILTKKNILRILLIIENLFIISLLLYIVIKNLENFKENFVFYFYTFDIFINENFSFLILALISVFLVINTHIILWKEIFQLNKIKLTYFQSLSLFSFIHFKRLFSPLGPISPILNINNDLKLSTIIYSIYIYFITLGSIIFFLLMILILYPIIIIAVLGLIILGYFIIKNNLLKFLNISINKVVFSKLTISSFLNEFFSFLAYYFSLKLFTFQFNFFEALIIYFIWMLISSFFPFLYGSGTSELVVIILIHNLGYDSALFGLAIVFYRLIISYLPLLGLIFYKISYPQFKVDK